MTSIEARAIGHTFRSGPPILGDIDLTAISGDMISVTGASGRGKSTLLFILGLLLTPRSGSVFVNGSDAGKLGDFSRSRLRAEVFGFLFQDAMLDPTRTVLDNVCEPALYRDSSPRSEFRERALMLLEQFRVDHRARVRPREVSGGQAQRIALCRALVHLPEIVIADEPTAGLDSDSAQIVLAALRARADAGGIVLTATHDRAVLAMCDRVVRL